MKRTIEAVLKLSSKMGSTKAFAQVGAQLDDVSRKAERYNRKQSAIARGARSLQAATMQYVGPAALGALAVNSVRLAGNFEDALFNIEKKAGATREQMAQIRGEILDLSKEVPVSINEIAAAYERGAAGGLATDQLKEFARLTTMVSDAWDMTAESVGNAFMGFETGLGLRRDLWEEYADLVNYLADSGIADEADIVNFVDGAGASLKSAGFTPEETAALGSSLLNLKMPAETAARAMDTLVGKLAAPQNLSPKSREALRMLVGDIKEFQMAFADDASGTLLDLLYELRSMPGQERIGVLGALLGEGFDDEINRLAEGVDEVKRNYDAINDRDIYVGSVGDLSQRKLENLNAQLEIMKNHFQSISISVGHIAAEPLADTLGQVAEIAEHVSELKTYDDAVVDGMQAEGRGWWGITGHSLARIFGLDDQAQTDRYAWLGGYRDEKTAALTENLTAGDLSFLDAALVSTKIADQDTLRRVPLPRSRPEPGAGPMTVPSSDWSGGLASVPIELDTAALHPMTPIAPPVLPYGWNEPPIIPFEDLEAGPGVLSQGATEAEAAATAAGAADRLLEFKRQAEEVEGVLRQGADDAGAALNEGAAEAGHSLTEAAARAGQDLGDGAVGRISGSAHALGEAIGDGAVGRIQGAVDGAVQRLEGAAGRLARRRARGNPGRTMEDAGTAE